MQSGEEEVLRNQGGFNASTSETGASETAAAQGPERSTQALNGRFVASFLFCFLLLCYL